MAGADKGCGIFVIGTVSERTRNLVDDGYKYTYTVRAGESALRITCLGEHEHIPVGVVICEGLRYRGYAAKSGAIMVEFRFAALGSEVDRGEAF